jgi:heme/copper-type cytochrome/quinol oxidase subunit 1
MDFRHNQGSQNARSGFLTNHVLTTDHKSVGLLFLWLALLSAVIGMTASVAMRLQLAHQEAGLVLSEAGAERHAALTLLHGSLMVFLC